MKRALLLLLALLLVLPVAAVVTAHWLIDGDALRTRLADTVRRQTGRELVIAGPIRLGWSLPLTLTADAVSLSNPSGFSRPAMALMRRAEAQVALRPLLSRRILIRRIALTAPDILLERDAQGRPNWVFEPPAAPAAAPSAAPATPSRPFQAVLGQVEIADATLAWHGAQTIAVTIPRLAYDAPSARLDGVLETRGSRFTLTGTASPVDLHLAGAGLTAAASGTAAAMDLKLGAPDLAALSALAGTRLPPLRNVTIATTASLAPGTLTLDPLAIASAQGDLGGNLAIAFAARPALRGTLSAARLDLDAMTPAPTPVVAAPVVATPAPPAPSLGQPPPPADGRLIPDTPLPFAAARAADADLQLRVAQLLWRGRTYTGLAAHLSAQDGHLRLDPASMTLGDQTLRATLDLDGATQAVAATIDAPGLPAGPVLALFGGPAAAAGTLDLRADLRGKGATWRAVAATLDGHAGLAIVDGEIDNAWLFHHVRGLLRAANLPFEPGGDSKLRCAAGRVDADAGTLHLVALSLDTTKLRLDGTGALDLANETLDLHLRPLLRLGAALSVPTRVQGSLRAPKVTLDAGAVAPGRFGLTIGGAPPPDTCGPALALARDGQPGPMPAAPAPSASGGFKPADLLRGLLR